MDLWRVVLMGRILGEGRENGRRKKNFQGEMKMGRMVGIAERPSR